MSLAIRKHVSDIARNAVDIASVIWGASAMSLTLPNYVVYIANHIWEGLSDVLDPPVAGPSFGIVHVQHS